MAEKSNSANVTYGTKGVTIKGAPQNGENVVLYVRPGDIVDFKLSSLDLNKLEYQLVGGDIVVTFPNGGKFTFASMALMGYSENPPILNMGSAGQVSLEQIFSKIEEVNELPIEYVNASFSVRVSEDPDPDAPKSQDAKDEAPPIIIIAQQPAEAEDDVPEDEFTSFYDTPEEQEDIAPLEDTSSADQTQTSSAAGVGISTVDDAVSAGLTFDIGFYQVKASVDATVTPLDAQGGGGSTLGNIDTSASAQFEAETIDLSSRGSASVIYGDSETLFGVNGEFITRLIRIRPQQPEGFAITDINIADLPSDFEIIHGSYDGSSWSILPQEIDEDDGSVVSNGFEVNDGADGRSLEFQIQYPSDQEFSNFPITLTLNSEFSLDNVDAGVEIELPDVLDLTAEKTLNLEVKEISVVGDYVYEPIDGEQGFILNSNNNKNIILTSQGDSTVYGGVGVDTISGNIGDDTLFGNDGNDKISGGAGTNIIDGGDNQTTGDTLSYSFLERLGPVEAVEIKDFLSDSEFNEIIASTSDGINVNLTDGTASGKTINREYYEAIKETAEDESDLDIDRLFPAFSDTFSNIENIEASEYNDVIRGDGLKNNLSGLGGNDSIFGEAGDDIIDGGDGDDFLEGGTDSKIGIDPGVDMSDLDAPVIAIEDLYGNIGDFIDGGAGIDSISFAEVTNATNTNGITVALYTEDNGVSNQAGIAYGVETDIGVDVLTGIENVTGSVYDDTIAGDASSNSLSGLDGADTLSGGNGDDNIYGYTKGFVATEIETLATTTTANGGISDNAFLVDDRGANGIFVRVNNDRSVLKIDGDTYTLYEDVITSGDNLSAFDPSLVDASDISNVQSNDVFSSDVNNGFYTDGDDYLYGGSGEDKIFGNKGNDTLIGGSGNDQLDGGDGIDSVKFDGSSISHVEVDLEARTGKEFDISGALIGVDTLNSIEVVYGSTGDDTLRGDDSDNTLYGDEGNDTLAGREGDDTLYGDDGEDYVDFSDSNNAVTADLANEVATGNGTDEIYGIEHILGSNYDDQLTGDAGENTIFGSLGNDTISGGDNNDELYGDRGNDTIKGDDGADILTGGEGKDTLDYSSDTGAVNIDLSTGTATDGYGKSDIVSEFEDILGSAYDDILKGDTSNNTLFGNAGDDTLIATEGNDRLIGGEADEDNGGDWADYSEIVGANVDLTTSIATGSGTDILSEIENVLGGTGNDVLTGNTDVNTLDGGTGDDTIKGYAGDDELIGGIGSDTVDYSYASDSLDIDLAANTAVIAGGGDSDTLNAFENVIGTVSDDTIDGSSEINIIDSGDGADTIDTKSNDDTIDAGKGNDSIISTDGSNTIDGGADIDTVDYSATSGVVVDLDTSNSTTASHDGETDSIKNVENIIGSSTDDNEIIGDSKTNILQSGSGNDTLFGEGGDDTLEAGAGDDSLKGGAGNDTIDGGTHTNSDLVDYSDATDGIELDLTNETTAQTISIDQGDDLVIGIEDVIGSNFNDTIIGDGDANIFTTLNGDDTIIGSSGDDRFDTGLGSDTLTYFTATSGVELTLDSSNFITTNTITHADTLTGTDTIRNIENIIGSNTADDSLEGDDLNNYFQGGGGADTLKGEDGLDTLEGGADDDFLSGGRGSDSLDGGTGVDTADYTDLGAVSVTLNDTNQVVATVNGDSNDNLQSIENIIGSNTEGDSIVGDLNDNYFQGQNGDDTLTGKAGDDTLEGGAGDDILSGGLNDDIIDGGSGSEIDGDTADFSDAISGNTTGIDVDLAITTAQVIGADQGSDTISNIENVLGSIYDDTIDGTVADNTLSGNDGSDTLTGLAGEDHLLGGAGVDTLDGGADNDSLEGGEGDDLLIGGTGSDYIDGQGGSGDTVDYSASTIKAHVQLNESKATVGGDLDSLLNIENVIGSDLQDTIVGDDVVNTLFGGNEADIILGGIGDDTLFGENEADTLSGGEGDDYIYGGIDGNPVNDNSTQDTASYKDVDNGVGVTIDMTNDNSDSSNAKVQNDGYGDKDYLYGIENIQGSDYKDYIIGDSNNNYILGEGLEDTLYGGAGDDTLDGGAQDDTLRGETGNDTLLGGDGIDVADYSTAASAIKVDLATYDGSGYNVSDDGDGGTDRLVGVENIIGTDLAGESDTIIGDASSNVITALDGNDTLMGASGLDTLDGGAGDDTFFGGADSDTLIGGDGLHDIVDYSDVTANGVKVDLEAGTATGDGNDILQTIEDIRGSDTVDGDTLTGSSSANTIYGGSGNDILEGGSKTIGTADADLLYGEDGDDTLRGDEGNDALFGGDGTTDTGTDTADYSTVVNGTNTGIDADLTRATAVIEDGYGTQDTLSGIENISGSQYDDQIKGSDTLELNVLSGNEGADSFITSDGQDSIVGGDGKDTVDYSSITNGSSTGINLDFDVVGEEKSIIKTTATGTYNDLIKTTEVVIGTNYDDTFEGGSGNDEFYGGVSNDTFSGNSGADTLIGEAGNDVIDGGADDDDLQGGSGNDTFIGGTGDDIIDGGTDNVDDIADGIIDIADYTTAETSITLDLDNNQVVGVHSGTDTISNIEQILATNYADTLIGNNEANVLDGRGSNDTIIGQGGDDTLIGFDGNDIINGGLGSDLLIGGSSAGSEDTAGFNIITVGGTPTSDVTDIVEVDLEGNNASVISIDRGVADTGIIKTYSFDVGATTISYTSVNGDTGNDVIEGLYDDMVSAGLTDIKQLNDTSNSPNIDVHNTSHRILIMDTSAGQTGFSISNVDADLTHTNAGTAISGGEVDYLFDFSNIIGTDFTSAGDTLEGNSGDNSINAGAGDDTIFATAGADVLDGEANNSGDGTGDWVDYSKQTSRVVVDLDDGSGNGVDSLNDILKNIENIRGTDAVAADTIFGDANDNIIEGGNNNNGADTDNNYETLRGGAGDDTIYGDYLDTLSVTGGRDIISGNEGNDTLYGGAASDRFYGGADADTYIGGSGTDYVYYNGDDGTNTAVEINLDTNTIDAHGDIYDGTDIYQEIEYIFGSDGGNDTFVGSATSSVLTFNGLNGADTITGGAGNENLIGEDGNDLLTGGAGNDVLSGQNNDDTFFAQEGVDTISGGGGTDLIDFSDTSIIGTAGASGIEVDLRATFNIGGTDYGVITDNGFGTASYILGVENLNATSGNDTFTGDDAVNVVNLYAGDDRAFISDGNDDIDGGANTVDLSIGGDWVDASNTTSGGSIYLSSNFASVGGGLSSITNFEHIKGSAQSDFRLQGDAQDNSILGEAGTDTLVGLAGNDYLDGGADIDTVSYSESGAESPASIVVRFDTATKTVNDGFGDVDTLNDVEVVIGSTNNDTFYGSTADDSFLSGGGQDSFISSLGDDFLSGNEGGVDASLVDYSNVAVGNKLILDLSAVSDQAQLVATVGGAKHFTDQLQNMKNVIMTNESDTITGNTADNSLYGRDGDDTFIATDGNDTYDGGNGLTNGTGDGNDWIDYSASGTRIVSDLNAGSTSKGINGSTDGLNSIEHIETGSNDDTIVASTSDNTVIANSGNDTVTSNDGDNVFYGDDSTDITTNDGTYDTIRYDFEDTGSGVTVDLSADGTSGTATNAYGDTDTLYNFENVVGSANTDIIVGSDDANSISGGAGNDTISGGLGADRLLGSTGNDVFKFTNNEFGTDTRVSGGDDNDTLEITNAASITDSDFDHIFATENILLSSDNVHTVSLGSNANTTGITNIDATIADSNSVTVVLDSMTNAMVVETGDGDDTIEYINSTSIDNDTIDTSNGSDTLFANSAQNYDFTSTLLTDLETIKFYQGASDQKITLLSDDLLEASTFEGNAGQTNTIQIETTAAQSDVDLTTGKTLTNIEESIINVTLGIGSELTGNTASKDTITGNSGDDTLSGLGGDDILTGNDGDDIFLDGTGNDIISAGADDDLVQFSVDNLDSNDTVDGGGDDDTLQILDIVTGGNLTDSDLTNVTNFETIQFGNFTNDITLDQDNVELAGGTNTDTFNYAAADFDSSDTIDGGNGIDELNITTAATKVLADFVNVSNVEELVTSAGNDDIDLSGGSNDFDTITMGDGDDTLTIDANNVWSGKTLDGGGNTATGDTLEIVGTVAVDLSATTVINFENLSSEDDLALTVKQVNALGTINIGTNTLSIVGNDGETVMSATNITADTIEFTSAMQNPTTINDVHMDIDASGSSQSITMNVDSATSKDGLDIQGSGNSDILNIDLASAEAITNTLTVDSNVATFNLQINDSDHTLDLDGVDTTTTLLRSDSNSGARTITVNNATEDVDASNFVANETLSLNATATPINIIGGASTTDIVSIDSGNTFSSTSGIEQLDILATNNLSNKIASDVNNIKVVGILTVAAADLSAHGVALEIDGGRTEFNAGTVGNNDYSNISLANSAELEMTVTSNLDISSQGSDNVSVLTDLTVNSGINFTLNADQTDDTLDINGATNSADVTIKSTATDGNNVFTNIANSGSGNIIYDVVTNVDKTGETSTILGAIDTVQTNSGVSFDVDSAQLGNITDLVGDGVFNVETIGNTTDLSGITTGSYTGEINIADSTGSDTITGSSYGENITISGGADTVDGADGADSYIYSGDANADNLIDTGTDGSTDKIVVEATADLRALNTVSGIEELNVNGNFTATINKTIADGVDTFSGTNGTSSVTVELTNGEDLDISAKTISNLDAITINVAAGGGNSTLIGTDSARNIMSVVDGTNIITGGALADTLSGGSGVDTFRTEVAHLTSSDTITGGGSSDILEFTDGGTVVDADFTNISSIETVVFSSTATNMTLGSNAGNIVTITGGTGNDSVTLESGGSYDSISAVETLNINRTIDLSGKITDVETINVEASGDITLDADDFLANIVVNNDNTATINNAITATMNRLDLTGSSGDTTINLDAGGTTIDFSSATFDGNVSIVGSTDDDIVTTNKGATLFNGGNGNDQLIIDAGDFTSSSIINFETITVNETLSLVGSIDDDIVTDIDVAITKELTLSAADLDTKTIDFGGAGNTTFAAASVNSNDYTNISVSGTGSLTMDIASTLDISGSASDNLGGITHLTLGTADVFTMNASQSGNTLDVNGNAASSDVIIETTTTDADNDFTNFSNTGAGNIVLQVVENVDKSGEGSSILGDIDSIIIDNGKILTLDANQISSVTSLDGSGVLNVNALGGATDLSGLVNGSFSGEINIITSNSDDTITGSTFDENIVYSADAQNDVIDGGSGTNSIVVNTDVDLSALSGANITNVTQLNVSGNYTATVDKDFVENSSVTTYTGTTGLTDFIKVSLGDGESIDLTSQTFSALKVEVDVVGGGGDSTIVGNDEVVNIITVVDGTNDITTFSSNDTITGGTGADTVTVGGGNDTVVTGSGNDVIKVATNSLTASDEFDGGVDANTIEYTNASTSTIQASDFTNVQNIQTLKLADGDNTMDFTTDAGSISIVDGSAMITSTSNLDITTGAQLNQVTGGAGDDSITYADVNLTSADIVDGGAGTNTLSISDGANVIASDLSNVNNIDILDLSNNTNTVDLTSSSIDSIEGGSQADTITAQGDELSIKTNAGDDVVSISSVPVGLLDGGGHTTGDTLNVTGNLDISDANIINFETIVTGDSLTMSAEQADGITMLIASGETLTISKNDSSTNDYATLDLTNITGAGNVVIGSGLGASLSITNVKVDLDASTVTENITISTADGSLDIEGSTDGTSTTSLTYTSNTTLTGTLTDIDTITANSGLSTDATLLDGKTQAFSTTNTITIDATTTSTDHDFDNITQSGSGNVVLNVDGSVDLSAQNITVIDIFDVANTQTLTLNASQLDGKETTATGTYTVTNLQDALTTDFSSVDSGTTLNVSWQDDTSQYDGNLDNVDQLTISSGVMSTDGSTIDEKTISGAGTLTITGNGDGALDVSNITTTPALDVDITDGAAILNGVVVDVNASGSTQNITINTDQLDQNFTGGAGSDTVVTSGAGAYTGTLTSIENFDNTNAVSFTVAQVNGETIEFGGAAITITDLDATPAANLSNLSVDGATLTVDVDADVTFTGTLDAADAVTFDLSANSVTLTSTAAKLDGKTVTDNANTTTVDITALESTLGADLSAIAADSVTAAFGTSGTFTGNLGTAVVTVANNQTFTADETIVDGQTLTGGTGSVVAINAAADGASVDIANISTSQLSVTDGITGSLTVDNAVIDVDASALTGTKAVIINTDQLDQNFTGGAGSDTVVTSGTGTYTGLISDIETLQVNDDIDLGSRFDTNVSTINVANTKTLTLDSADLHNETIAINSISGSSKIRFEGASAGNNNYVNITGTSSLIMALTASTVLSAADDITTVNTIDLNGNNFSADSSFFSGRTLSVYEDGSTGSSRILDIVGVDASSVDLSSITLDGLNTDAALTFSVLASESVTLSGISSDFSSIDVAGTLITTSAIANGATISNQGVGSKLVVSDSGSIDASNILVDTIEVGSGVSGTVTITNLKTDVDASSASSANLDLTIVADGVNVTTAGGTNTINANALTDGQEVVITGDDNATVNLTTGDVDASTSSGDITVTATTGTNEIQTGTGVDIINIFSLDTNDIINGGADTDTLNITDTNDITYTDADFTNLSNFEVLNLSDAGKDTIDLRGSELQGAGFTIINTRDGDDNVTLDFSDLSSFTNINTGSDDDTVFIAGTNNTDTIGDTEFSNLEQLNFTNLDTGDTLDITFDNLNSWKESGESEFIITVDTDGGGNIDATQQFDQVDNSGTTSITTTGDYIYTNGTPAEDITLHVVAS